MSSKLPMKRKFEEKIVLQSQPYKPPVTKRRRYNNEEPVWYLFDNNKLTFPALSAMSLPSKNAAESSKLKIKIII